MLVNLKKIYFNVFFLSLFAVIYYDVLFYGSLISSYKVHYIFLGLIAAQSVLQTILKQRMPRFFMSGAFSLLLYLSAGILSYFYTGKESVIFLKAFSILVLPFIFSLAPWDDNGVHKTIGLFVVAVILAVFSSYFIWSGSFVFFFDKGTNPNSIGILMFYSVFFYLYSLSGEKRKFANNILILVGFGCVILSGSRAAILGLMSTFVTYRAYPYLKSRVRAIGFISLFFLAVASFVALYVYIGVHGGSGNATFLGKGVFSGRQVIWKNTLEAVYDGNLLFGQGPGTSYTDISDVSLSTHNGYLGVLLSTGALGLLAYLIFFGVLWVRLCTAPRDRNSRLVAAFFIGVLMIAVFENLLFSQTLGLLWAVKTSLGLRRPL